MGKFWRTLLLWTLLWSLVMARAPYYFVFSQVSSESATSAFAFHSSIAKTDSHVWPRTEEEINHFAQNFELLGVRDGSSGKLVGLCYATFKEQSNEYEIGGLAVLTVFQRLGLAAVLVRFAIAYVIANERPSVYGRKIIAHIHEANHGPRNLATRIGFESVGTVRLRGTAAPESMRRNAEGEVVSEKFVLPCVAVRQLLSWFEIDFHHVLKDRAIPAVMELSYPANMENLLAALRQEVVDCGAEEARKTEA